MKSLRPRRPFWATLFLIVLSSVGRSATGPAVKPSALGITTSGELVLLDSARGVFGYTPGQERLRPIVRGFDVYRAIDLAVAAVDGRDCIFVTLVLRSGSTEISRLTQYQIDGRQVASWQAPASVLLAGIGIDSKGGVAYLADARDRQIFKVSIRERGSRPVFVASTPGQRGGLGPLVVDMDRQRLFVGSTLEAAVYVLDLQGTLQSTLRTLGEPGALAFDRVGNRLFVADTGGPRIGAALLQKGPRAFAPFAAPSRFREPRALAYDPSGILWAGDGRTGSIARISTDGKTVQVFTLVDRE